MGQVTVVTVMPCHTVPCHMAVTSLAVALRGCWPPLRPREAAATQQSTSAREGATQGYSQHTRHRHRAKPHPCLQPRLADWLVWPGWPASPAPGPDPGTQYLLPSLPTVRSIAGAFPGPPGRGTPRHQPQPPTLPSDSRTATGGHSSPLQHLTLSGPVSAALAGCRCRCSWPPAGRREWGWPTL